MSYRPRQDHRITAILGAGLLSGLSLLLFDSQPGYPQNSRKAPTFRRTAPNETELTRLRADVIEKIKETRAGAEKLLALHETERVRIAALYEQRREQYYSGLIARNDVLQAEQALADAMLRVDEDKRWLAETDVALIEYSTRDELLRLPALAIGGYSESNMFLRFNGGAAWSLADSSKIEKFFTQTFGRAMPISAFGQTATHDRLRFDHRRAMDVALHPDSLEGRALLRYLREAGIPFIAFRNAVPGAATGAHIHIGKPSRRS